MIRLENVSKKVGDEWVLKSIHLSLEENKIYGFQGRNGSGKTMLFRAMTGLISLDEGKICFGEQIVDGTRPLKEVGLLLENPAFISDMSGWDNLKLLSFLKKNVEDEEIDRILEEVGLENTKHKAYGKYSLGMKQRLGIAASLIGKPKYIFLDEPTNALDEEGIEILKKILKKRKEKGVTIFIASHDPLLLAILADQIIRMNKGEIIQNN